MEDGSAAYVSEAAASKEDFIKTVGEIKPQAPKNINVEKAPQEVEVAVAAAGPAPAKAEPYVNIDIEEGKLQYAYISEKDGSVTGIEQGGSKGYIKEVTGPDNKITRVEIDEKEAINEIKQAQDRGNATHIREELVPEKRFNKELNEIDSKVSGEHHGRKGLGDLIRNALPSEMLEDLKK